MKIRDELVGRDVLDGTGHKIGEVDDIEVDFDSQRIDAIIIGEGKLIGRGRERRIPFNMVETVGERVLLKRETEGKTAGREDRIERSSFEREGEGGSGSYVEERDLSGRERSRRRPNIREEERY
ncbi:MAG: PRC-barrel domain-containing protein [Methanobacterium sp.]